MEEVVICGALRTPIGSFLGSFKDVSAVELGRQVVDQLLESTGCRPEDVDGLVFGNVLAAGQGQNVARQVALHSGMPVTTTAYTVNMVCGSGLKAVELAAQSIQLGECDLVVAGGTESMSQAPFVVQGHRTGRKMGHDSLVDTVLQDGLTDAFSKDHMGLTAEKVAEDYIISREAQDAFALASQEKARQAQEAGRFDSEIAVVEVTHRRQTQRVDRDEYPRDTSMEQLAGLRPAFKSEGTVTAGNASGINDGAAALLLASRKRAEEIKLPILGRIVASASAGVDPAIMGTGPIPASRKALEKAGLTMEDMDLVEANEAFASQALCVMDQLAMDPDKVNVNGGAIALGHPIGASGARILVTLLHEMQRRQSGYGLATLCIGGGQGLAMIIAGE